MNHLEKTKEAYLEMMKSLLEERREITQMYYEVKSKVDEIDKLLIAGDSGKVSNGQAAEIMAYAELFNNKQKKEEAEEKPKVYVGRSDGFFGMKAEPMEFTKLPAREKLVPRVEESKELPKPRPTTREDLITSSVADSKEDKHILPAFPEKSKKRVGRGKGGAAGEEGHKAIVEVLKKHGMPIHVKQLHELVAEKFEAEILFHSFQSVLSKFKAKDERIQNAGRGWYVYKG